MLYVTLEIPLATFDFVGFFQRDDICTARIEMLHEALYRAALTSRVAALEQDDHFLAGLLCPRLQLEKLNLQLVFLLLVVLARHEVLVRITSLAPAGSQFVVRAARQARVRRTEPLE